jgi:hypothetical protein
MALEIAFTVMLPERSTANWSSVFGAVRPDEPHGAANLIGFVDAGAAQEYAVLEIHCREKCARHAISTLTLCGGRFSCCGLDRSRRFP